MKTNRRLVLSLLLLVSMLVSVFAPMAGSAAEAVAEEQALLTNSDINIRDPFIVTYEGRYYMYGTEGETAFSDAMDRFLVYVSTDLETWEGPYVIFQNDGTFWANQKYWAPAVYVKDGTFYFYGAMGSDSRVNGIQLFTADNPLGPFTPQSEAPLTGEDYEAIDAEIYEEDGKTYMLFSSGAAGICYAELNETLDAFVTEPVRLFDVGGCGWATPMFGDSLLNDGAAILRTEDGRLVCFFSITSPLRRAVKTIINLL